MGRWQTRINFSSTFLTLCTNSVQSSKVTRFSGFDWQFLQRLPLIFLMLCCEC